MHLYNNLNYAFIHIPKCGGTSVKNFLLNEDNKWELNSLHDKYQDDSFSNFFKFTFVRNPYDRAVSYYTMMTRERGSFFDFIQSYFETMSKFNRFAKCKMLYFIKNEHNNKINVDFIGKYENLNSDFKELCSILKIQYKDLPHLNKSKRKHKDYRKYYNSNSYNLVSNFFKEDLEHFKYSFD